MKKNLKILCLSLLLVLVGVVGSPQKVQAGPLACPVNGQYHVPNNTRISTVTVKINSTNYLGTLWKCDCGAEVIGCDYGGGSFTYPSLCDLKQSPGYPYLPGSYTYYVPRSLSYVYYGTPSDWINVR